MRQCRQVRRYDILDRDEISLLLPRAVNNDLLTSEHLPGEDRYNARFTTGILPGPIDVRIAQDGEVEIVEFRVQREVVLWRVFRNAVRTERTDPMLFVTREVLWLAVHDPARRDVDDFPGARPSR